jgi:hypothetical protein
MAVMASSPYIADASRWNHPIFSITVRYLPFGDKVIAISIIAINLLANLGQVILAVGILDVGHQLRPFAHQMHPAPAQIPRGTHFRRIHIRLWEHPATE